MHVFRELHLWQVAQHNFSGEDKEVRKSASDKGTSCDLAMKVLYKAHSGDSFIRRTHVLPFLTCIRFWYDAVLQCGLRTVVRLGK